jgi:hypothetical protein
MVLTLGVQAVMNIAVVTVSVPQWVYRCRWCRRGNSVIFLGCLVGVWPNVARRIAGSNEDET